MRCALGFASLNVARLARPALAKQPGPRRLPRAFVNARDAIQRIA